jgi:8-oxo-dGTP diphosphatase
VGAAAAIFNAAGHVLLVRHTYGRLNWELPGGASEPGESVIETAIREVQEETGLDVFPKQLTGVYYDEEYDAHHFVFLCSAGNGRPDVRSAEVDACRFWSPDELPRPMSDFTVRRIEDARSERLTTLPVVVSARRWLD